MATAVATRGTAPEGRNRLLVIGAIALAFITAVLLFAALRSHNGGSTDEIKVTTQDVLVVNRDVDANTILTADMLKVQAVPADQVLNHAYASADLAVGLPARFPLQAGEQVTQEKVGLTSIQDENDLALLLPPGQRAFAVQASEVNAVGGNLLPGNTVDVIAVFDEGTFGGATRAETVLQDISVLAIAQEALEPVPAAASSDSTDSTGTAADSSGTGIDGQRKDGVESQPRARSVTLAVDLNQAQLLATLQSQDGIELWLALRRPDEPQVDGLSSTNLGPFFQPPLPSQN